MQELGVLSVVCPFQKKKGNLSSFKIAWKDWTLGYNPLFIIITFIYWRLIRHFFLLFLVFSFRFFFCFLTFVSENWKVASSPFGNGDLGLCLATLALFLACYVNLVSDVFLTSRSIFPKHDIPLFFYTHRSRRPCSSSRSQLMLRYRGDLFPLGTNLG